MFVRVKTTPKSPRKTVQIVESKRVDGKVKQRIVQYVGVALVRHLEHRVRLQYIKLSPEKIRKILLSIQVSVLYDTKTDKKFAMPSKISNDAKKIYKLMGVPIFSKPYLM